MEFYGLLGEKLSHSLSPEIHNSIFKELNIEGAYKLFEIKKEEIGELKKALKLLDIKGINVTIPYKEEVIKFLDHISSEAKEIGAVNTIALKDGKLTGYNTDYFGFGKMLEINGIQVENKDVVVLGTGGASKAVVAYLRNSKAKSITLVSRKKMDSLNDIVYKTYEDEINGDVLINTTPVGMYPNVGKSPLSKDVINCFDVVVDLIYNPSKSELILIAEDLGKKICGGLEMLIYQAVKAEEIWQEREVPQEISDKLYGEIIKRFS